MELHQLKYFISVAETASFSKAARRCYVAQPSLSQQIIKLEKELGRKLFDRLGKKVMLTDAGVALLPHAQTILRESHDAKFNITRKIEEGRGTVTVGIIPTIAPYLLPRCMQAFERAYPEAEMRVIEKMTDQLVEMLIDFEIDMAVMSLPIKSPLIVTEKLFDDPLVLAVPRDSGLVGERSVGVGDLNDVPFVALDEEHCLGEQVRSICYEHKINPSVICKTWNLNTVLSFVSIGSGVSIVPLMSSHSSGTEGCEYKELRGGPFRTVVSAYHKSRSKKLLCGRFEGILRDEYRKMTTGDEASP